MSVARTLRTYGFDLLVLALAVTSEAEIWLTDVPGPTAVLVPAVLLYTLPLLLRRRFPFLAPVFVLAVHVALSFAYTRQAFGSVDTGQFAIPLTFWAVGAHNKGQQAIAGLGLGLGTIAIITAQDVRVTWAQAANLAFVCSLAWLTALVLSSRARSVVAAEARAERLQREQELSARAALAEERARIARELHDVVAHSVSVMTVQAGAARLLLSSDPRRAAEPLAAVEETGRQALAEMRRLLGILRQDGDPPTLAPQPGLADLPALVATVREAGVPVHVSIEGDPRPLPTGVELAAYRITQEALTNTLKHAGPANASVTVRYEPRALALEICDDGRTGRGDGQGHGIVGMRERAELYGGTLEAGPQPGGGFVVRATLPVDSGAGRP